MSDWSHTMRLCLLFINHKLKGQNGLIKNYNDYPPHKQTTIVSDIVGSI